MADKPNTPNMPEPAKKQDPLLNSVVAGRYEIFAKLGEGGMGAVYAAKQKPLGRTIALKVLLKSLSEDEVAVGRFEKEALAISRLAHPNTVTIFDYGKTEQGLMYIAMEFMEGRTLSDVIRQEGPLRPRRVVRIIAQIVRALSEAHQRGVIHRDLKPDNIMLVPTAGEPDFVKVLDFGVAKLRAQEGFDAKTLTKGDVIFGTPAYMSPQQVHGIMDDPRSDLYAVGVIAYEMLAGAPLFTGDSAISILMAQVQKIPPAFASLPQPVEVPAALEALVMKLLAKESADRYQDCDALLHGLDALPGLGGGLRPPSGDTLGMQKAALTPVAQPKPSTQMMGSDFAQQKQAAASQSAAAPAPVADDPAQQAPTEAIADFAGLVAGDRLDADKARQGIDPGAAPAQTQIDAAGGATVVDTQAAGARPPATAAQSDPEPPAQTKSPLRGALYVALGLLALILFGLLFVHLTKTQKQGQGAPHAAQQVQLKVLSQPAGAQISLDGQPVGVSPTILKVLPGRSYQLGARLDGYKPASQRVEVKTNTSMQFTLVALPAPPARADRPAQPGARQSDKALKDKAASKAGAHKAGTNKAATRKAGAQKAAAQKAAGKKAGKTKPAGPSGEGKNAASELKKIDEGTKANKNPPPPRNVRIPANEGAAEDFEKFDDFKPVE